MSAMGNTQPTLRKLEPSPSLSVSLYEDKDFPADSTVLFRGGQRVGVVWKRPGEISKNPVFVDAGTKYNDIDQGELGDCWFLSSIACLAVSQHKDVLSHVIPKDQSFRRGYTGKFNFNFWQYGKWVNVVIDDRLPTYNGELIYCKNSQQPNEFWGPLLEKAYAKLHGNYNVIDGGRTHTALVDLTGGLGELVPLKENISDEELTDLLFRSQKLNSFLGGSIFVKMVGLRESVMPSGLLEGHAYTIVKVKEVNTSKGKFVLLHIRNPHGRGEWKGSWSDRSLEWKTLSEEDKRETSGTDNDGEFWISVSDFRKHFDELELCHITPEGLTDGSNDAPDNLTKNKWKTNEFRGKWDNTSAGGPPFSFMSKKFWSNPQIELQVSASSQSTNVIISLFEVDNLLNRSESDISIGFSVFQFPKGQKIQRVTADNYYELSPRMVETSGVSWPYRERTKSFQLESGNFIIVPYTSRTGQIAEFYLRVFTEGSGSSHVATHEITRSPEPTVTNDILALDKAFDGLAGNEGAIDAEELVEVLRAALEAAEGKPVSYSVETCRCLIALTNTSSKKGLIDRSGVQRVWAELTIWREAFHDIDKDKNNLIDAKELKTLFDIIELKTSPAVTETLMKRYGGKKEKVTEDDFLQGVCTALQLRGKYLEYKRKGQVDVDLYEWMTFGLSI